MSYYSRHRGGRDKERSTHDGRREYERRWSRDPGYNSFRKRSYESYGSKNYRYRSYRDKEVVLIRRDREREDDKKPELSHEKKPPDIVPRSPQRNTDFQKVSKEKQQRSIHHGSKVHHHLTSTTTITGIPLPDTIGHASYQLPFAKLETATLEQPDSSIQLNQIEQETINKCISNFKTRGDYDRIRRECMLDIDTKPAFSNAVGKVADITSKFLQTAQYHPNMDKAKMRENLKKSFELSRNYQNGVESLVNQILLPKISSIIQPMVHTEILRVLNTDESKNCASNTNQDSHFESVCSSSPKNLDITVENKLDSRNLSSYLPPMKIIMDSNIVEKQYTSTSNNQNHYSTELGRNNDVDLQIHDVLMKELKGEVNRELEKSSMILENQTQTEKDTNTSSLKENSNAVVKPNDVSFYAEGQKEFFSVAEHNESSNIVMESTSVITLVDLSNDLEGKSLGCSHVLLETADEYQHTVTDSESSNNELVDGHRKQYPVVDIIMKGKGNDNDIERRVDDIEGKEDDIEDDFELMEGGSESEEESPEFEKIGDVSPVLIGTIPVYEFASCKDRIVQQNDEAGAITNPTTVSVIGPNACQDSDKNDVIEADESEHKSAEELHCKYLDLSELTGYHRKIDYFNRIKGISPTHGKTKNILPKN